MRYLCYLTLSIFLSVLMTVSAFADAGKSTDAGDSAGTAIRVLLRDNQDTPRGKSVSFSGTLGGMDIVDSYTISPTIGKNRFISVLGFSRTPVTLRVMDKNTDNVLAAADVIEQQTLEYITQGPVYLQVETSSDQPEFQYHVALWLAPAPEKAKSTGDIRVGENINEPPDDYEVFVRPDRAGADSAKKGFGVLKTGALIAVIAVIGVIMARMRKKA